MIRNATIDDIPNILPLVHNFAKELQKDILYSKYSIKHSASLLAHLVDTGICLIDIDSDNNVNGVIGGLVSGNIWNPTIKQVDEVIYYVREEKRRSTIGFKLIKEYDKLTKEYPLSTLKLMHNSPDLTKHYNKLGYELLEKTYLRGG